MAAVEDIGQGLGRHCASKGGRVQQCDRFGYLIVMPALAVLIREQDELTIGPDPGVASRVLEQFERQERGQGGVAQASSNAPNFAIMAPCSASVISVHGCSAPSPINKMGSHTEHSVNTDFGDVLAV